MKIPPDLVAKYPLAPILIAQALYVRSRARELPEPPGQRQGISGSGPALRLLIVGDSAAAGVGAKTQSSALSGQLVSRLSTRFRIRWKLSAMTGRTTADTLQSLQELTPEPFDVVVTVHGVNDVTRRVSKANFLAHQDELLQVLAQKFGNPFVLVSGVAPMRYFPLLPNPLRWYLGCRSDRFDLALEQMLADRPGCLYLPIRFAPDPASMASDGYHPGPSGYRLWSEFLAEPILANFAGSNPGPS